MRVIRLRRGNDDCACPVSPSARLNRSTYLLKSGFDARHNIFRSVSKGFQSCLCFRMCPVEIGNVFSGNQPPTAWCPNRMMPEILVRTTDVICRSYGTRLYLPNIFSTEMPPLAGLRCVVGLELSVTS